MDKNHFIRMYFLYARAIASAPIPALLIYAIALFIDPVDEGVFSVLDLLILAIIGVIIYVLVYFLGLPAIIFASKKKLIRWEIFVLAGLIGSFVVAILFDLPDINILRYKYYFLTIFNGVLTTLVAFFLVRKI